MPPGWAPGLNPGPAKNYLMTFLKIILILITLTTGITWSMELKLSTLNNISDSIIWGGTKSYLIVSGSGKGIVIFGVKDIVVH